MRVSISWQGEFPTYNTVSAGKIFTWIESQNFDFENVVSEENCGTSKNGIHFKANSTKGIREVIEYIMSQCRNNLTILINGKSLLELTFEALEKGLLQEVLDADS